VKQGKRTEEVHNMHEKLKDTGWKSVGRRLFIENGTVFNWAYFSMKQRPRTIKDISGWRVNE
jgi:hypothetical protein